MSPARKLLCVVLALPFLWLGQVAPASAAKGDPGLRVKSKVSWSAKILLRTKARRKPGFHRRVKTTLKTESTWSKGPQQLLVLDSTSIAGRSWIKLRLSSRPNNASAWIPRNRVRLVRNPWRVLVSTNNRRVTVYRAGRKVLRFAAVVGKPSTPTPEGLFAIYERVRQSDPSGFVGPFALHLTAHSNVLDNYGGGPGRVAIHGRGGASFLDPLGSARSHGCIRVNNSRIRFMAKHLPLGTPVKVR